MTFDEDILRATDETNLSEDLALMLDIIDKIKMQQHGSSEFLKALSKRLKHKIPFVVMQCLSLLDMAVKNCGREFKIEVSSRDFVSELQNLTKRSSPKIVQRLTYLMKGWIDSKEFDGPEYNLLTSFYQDLKYQGYASEEIVNYGTQTSLNEKKQNAAALSKQEEEDIAKAIANSLNDMNLKSAAADTNGETSLYSTVNKRLNELPKAELIVKAMFDFEAVEDDELSFKAGDVITVSDSSDMNWWKGSINGRTGLFPVSFVTKDLNYEPEKQIDSIPSNEKVADISKSGPQVVSIDERRIDECLNLLKNADPTAPLGSDPAELQLLEENCYAMGPLIDKEIGCLDRLIHNCNLAKSQMIEALQNYHVLMQETRLLNDNPAYRLQEINPNNPASYVTLDYIANQIVSAAPPSSHVNSVPPMSHASMPHFNAMPPNIPQQTFGQPKNEL